MKRSWWTRFIFLLLFTCLSIAAILPTIFDFNENNNNYFISSKINLGLDLQGGLYMVLGIDFKKVYKDEVATYAKKIVDLLGDYETKAEIGKLDLADPLDPKHTINLLDPNKLKQAVDQIKKSFPGLLRITGENAGEIQFALSNVLKTQIEEQSVTKSIEVIRNRIDEFGVTEPEIVSQGNDRIVVALPGVKDIEQAKSLIGKTAQLTFRVVNDNVGLGEINTWLTKAKEAGIEYKKGEKFSNYLDKLNSFLKDDLPKGFSLAFKKTLSRLNNSVENMEPFVLNNDVKLTGDLLQDAFTTFGQEGMPIVSLSFKTRGSKVFEELTGNNIGKRLAIVLDGNVYSAPSIRSRISGNAQIELGRGNTQQILKEARELAMVLRAGALPVQLDFLEQRTVGPSLGHDSIEKARLASIIGCALVFIFICFYYKISGFIALTTLALNVLFILAALVGLEATLTLPGIAGIALTIGMAVDANIIVYERIREEVRKGVGNYKAVENGFAQAFWTVLDANFTTAMAGICLINFGTGPIRGFAVTLLIGIAATVYTSYFVGKMLFELYMNKVEGEDLSI
ncbi:MAG: protein translocase subunit SecD [Halobacteriovoraceae bacterium]|nr:protein translocase subunit SecD [Halobacteriovoraceae bacterium]